MKKYTCACIIGSSLILCSCEIPAGVVAGNSAVAVSADPSPSIGPSGFPAPSPTSSVPVVCDPLGPSSGTATSSNGLLAHLYYTPAGGNTYADVESYINNDPVAPADLFFNQLNVPTRSFSEGFSTTTGTVLVDPETGNTLYEWFALHFESQIQLGATDHPGRYQFAVLSDDGALLWLDQGATPNTPFINNDGETPSRLRCATSGINFSAATTSTPGTLIPMKLDYFQGPRYNIALMLLWREIPSCGANGVDTGADLYDEACNQAGNDTFFIWENDPATPTDLWLGMLSRGWKVLSPDNYVLPTAQGVTTNPCATPSASPTPTPSVTATPTPSPTETTTGGNPAPSVTPSVGASSAPSSTPSAAPSAGPSSCSGPLCGGGVVGV
jgi:hypothetical protein